MPKFNDLLAIVDEISGIGSKAKKDPNFSRHFLALLNDLRNNPDSYDVESFAGNQKLVALYQEVRGRFADFIKAFDATASETIPPVRERAAERQSHPLNQLK